MTSAWIYLIFAGIFEMVWVVSIKYSNGFSRLFPSAITLIAMALSVYTLAKAVKYLPLGTAYAIWTGIGSFGAAVYGIMFFNESKEFFRLFSLALIIFGVIGLKFSTK